MDRKPAEYRHRTPDAPSREAESGERVLSTRFQGSKVKTLDWIWRHVRHLDFDTCLDAFGGTGSVAHFLKRKGKRVHYNDCLAFNHTIGKAIVENDTVTLPGDEAAGLLEARPDIDYPGFIRDTFGGIFFLDEENRWLDRVVTNIHAMGDEYRKAVAFAALFQACIIKRPYNLFHRANLYMRTADVQRSFGNKTTWDRPFPVYFRKFAAEINAVVFSNGRRNRAFCSDIFDVDPGYDLVYIDTPYLNARGTGFDYLDGYHFLEGLLDYSAWPDRIADRYKHKRLKGETSLWCRKDRIHDAFDRLFARFCDSILVVSYRTHGIPTVDELVENISRYKRNVAVHATDYTYALSRTRGQEVLLVGT